MQTKRIGCKQKTKTCHDASSNLDQLTPSLATSYKLQIMILKSWWTWLMGLIGLIYTKYSQLRICSCPFDIIPFSFQFADPFLFASYLFCLYRDRFCFAANHFLLYWPLWATMWDKFIFISSLRIDLNSCSFYTNCYREWILNTFTYFWCCLELFIEKFIPNINNEHAQDYSCPGVTFAFCSHGEKLPRQGGLPSNPPLEVTLGQRKTYVNSYRAPDHAPRQSWPQGQWAAPGQWVVLGSCEQALSYIISKLYPNLAYAKSFTEKLCPLKQILFKV